MTDPDRTRLAFQLAGVSVAIAARTILSEVTLSLRTGRILGVLGGNGAGKTTLMQVLSGERSISQGTVRVLGETVPFHERATWRRIGIVPQDTALYDELTVREQLLLFASVYGLARTDAALMAIIDLLGLAPVSSTRADRLSGGMRRRVVIARALLHQPELLLVDEPTLAVDADTRHLIWRHLRSQRDQGRTVVIATNYLEEARAVCDEVVVLRQGRLQRIENLDQLLERSGIILAARCTMAVREQLCQQLRSEQGVVRADPVPDGLELMVGESACADLGRLLSSIATISAWHRRAADLSDLLRFIEQAP